MRGKRWRIVFTAAAIAFLLGIAAFSFGPTVERKFFGKVPPTVATLHDISQLQSAFNRDAGTTRLVFIFSPT